MGHNVIKKHSFKLSQNWIGVEKPNGRYEYGKVFTDSDTLDMLNEATLNEFCIMKTKA